MWCSLLDLKMNAQPFRLRPAALWEMQVEILQVGVWTHGWLRPHAVKYRYISVWVQKKTQMRVGKGKRWGVMPLVKCKVAIATSAFGCRLKYGWGKKTALFESTSQWCINDLIDVLFSCHESAGAENEASHYVLHMCGLEESGYPVQKTLLDHWKTD